MWCGLCMYDTVRRRLDSVESAELSTRLGNTIGLQWTTPLDCSTGLLLWTAVCGQLEPVLGRQWSRSTALLAGLLHNDDHRRKYYIMKKKCENEQPTAKGKRFGVLTEF